MRLGHRAALTTPQQNTMSEVVAIMTGAARGTEPGGTERSTSTER
jgi:hypothetical protein